MFIGEKKDRANKPISDQRVEYRRTRTATRTRYKESGELRWETTLQNLWPKHGTFGKSESKMDRRETRPSGSSVTNAEFVAAFRISPILRL